jgi:hypothetical protein
MFYAPFWILMAMFLAMAIVTIIIRGFKFIDLQAIVGIIAVSLIFDMVFCKWLQYYSYVVTVPLKAFYSLMFCIIGYPAIGLTFIKFLPVTWKKIILYIAIWSATLTIIEIITVPFKIVLYTRWYIIPYSPIIYIISYTWLYGYYKVLANRLK